jgi:hypothetical protein
MKNQTTLGFGAFVILAAGCAYGGPYKTSGPSLSEQGVQVNVAGARCYVNREGEPYPDVIEQDQADLDLRLQIKNDSGQVAEISEGRIRLAETDAPATAAAPPEQSGVISVPPGATTQVPLKFEPSGVDSCRHAFALEMADSVDLAGSPIALSPIRFGAAAP